MTPEEKKEESRSYARGYNAGRKTVARRAAAEKQAAHLYAKKVAFLERAFLAALPACIAAVGWTKGDNKITSMTDKTTLAWDFAEAAAKQRRWP